MFTGIVEELAQIKTIEAKSKTQRISFTIASKTLMDDIKIGDSISVNGVWLSIVDKKKDSFCLDLVEETLNKSNLGELKVGSYVNLERAMKADSRFDGHIVQGHIEGIAKIVSVKKENDSFMFSIALPNELVIYCIYKGSIAINGISLTIAKIEDNIIDIWIIPHTLRHTTFGKIKENDWFKFKSNKQVGGFTTYLWRVISGEIDQEMHSQFVKAMKDTSEVFHAGMEALVSEYKRKIN